MFSSVFRFGYWFHVYAIPFLPSVSIAIVLILSILTLGGGIGYIFFLSSRFEKLDKYERRLWRSVSLACFWFGVAGFLLFAMTGQRIPILSMRIWWVVWLGIVIWVVSRFVRRARKKIPAERRLYSERAAYEKWLPKPKRK